MVIFRTSLKSHGSSNSMNYPFTVTSMTSVINYRLLLDSRLPPWLWTTPWLKTPPLTVDSALDSDLYYLREGKNYDIIDCRVTALYPLLLLLWKFIKLVCSSRCHTLNAQRSRYFIWLALMRYRKKIINRLIFIVKIFIVVHMKTDPPEIYKIG